MIVYKCWQEGSCSQCWQHWTRRWGWCLNCLLCTCTLFHLTQGTLHLNKFINKGALIINYLPEMRRTCFSWGMPQLVSTALFKCWTVSSARPISRVSMEPVSTRNIYNILYLWLSTIQLHNDYSEGNLKCKDVQRLHNTTSVDVAQLIMITTT